MDKSKERLIMNYFFGFDVYLSESIDWMFNSNHLFLLIIGIFIVLGLLFALNAKSKKGQIITKLVLAGIMLVLEIGRLVWYYQFHISVGGTPDTFNWWWRISFQMCSIMCWTTIITLIASAFINKDNKVIQILKNILFGCAMIGGILTFIYPDFITETRSLLHFQNFQTLIIHAFLVLVPLYLIKIGELKIRFKDIWMPALGFLMIGSLSMMASQISGQNFAYALRCALLQDVGLDIAFPWHLPLVFAIVFLLTIIAYGIGEMVNYRKNRGQIIVKEKAYNKKIRCLSVFTLIFAIIQNMLLLLIIPLFFSVSPVENLLGFICLVPIIIAIIMLLISEKIKNISMSKDWKNKLTKKNNIIYIIMLFICNIILGICYLIAFLKAKKS